MARPRYITITRWLMWRTTVRYRAYWLLNCLVWYDMIWYGMIWYDMVWYDMIWYDMIWYDMV